jgi:hypothetical protein
MSGWAAGTLTDRHLVPGGSAPCPLVSVSVSLPDPDRLTPSCVRPVAVTAAPEWP